MSAVVKAPVSHTRTMLAYRAAQREQEAAKARVEIPPVLLAATAFDPSEKWCPQGPRSLYNQAKALGLWARATRACGPWIDADGGVTYPSTYSISVAVRGPLGQRIVFSWRFHHGKWESTGALGPWVMLIEGEQIYMPWAQMNLTDGKAVMKSWTTTA